MAHRSTRNLGGCCQWAPVQRLRARFALLGAAVTAIAVASLVAPGVAAAAPPTLQGETLAQDSIWVNNPPPCVTNTYGNGGAFCVDGTATGPYPGAFHESGSYVTASTDPNSNPDTDYGYLTSYDIKFTIDSPTGKVTGTESVQSGTYLWNAGIGGYDESVTVSTNYTAIIDTPDGQAYSDYGTTSTNEYQSDFGQENGETKISDLFAAAGNAVTVISPTPVTQPTISGSLVAGQTLYEGHAEWTNSPTSYSYQWQLCDPNGNNCSDITTGANGESYKLTNADAGNEVQVQETAKNSYGSGTATSAPVAISPAPPPGTLTLSNLAASVSGSTVDVSVDTSPDIVNVTLEEAGKTIAPDTTPVNGVASWTVTLPAGTHTLEVQGWNSPSGTPGQHSGVLATTVVIGSSPPPPPPPPSSGSSTVVVTTSPVVVVIVNVTEIKARILDHLVPSAAKLAELLKTGRYTYSFNTLSAGQIVINWYRVTKHALVATGQAAFSKAGLVKVRMKLTANGRRMLKATKSLKLTAKGTYTPTGQSAIAATKTFTLRR